MLRVVDQLLQIPDLVVNKADVSVPSDLQCPCMCVEVLHVLRWQEKLRTPLFVAAKFGLRDVVARLLADPRIDANRANVRR